MLRKPPDTGVEESKPKTKNGALTANLNHYMPAFHSASVLDIMLGATGASPFTATTRCISWMGVLS